jgi:hypothetical protein
LSPTWYLNDTTCSSSSSSRYTSQHVAQYDQQMTLLAPSHGVALKPVAVAF